MNDLNIDELAVQLYSAFCKISKANECVLFPKEVFDVEDEFIKQELHRIGVETYFNNVVNGDDEI